jgi:hypothetical protein
VQVLNSLKTKHNKSKKEPKKLFTVRFYPAVIRDIKSLSVYTGNPVSTILAEAVSGLVRKLRKTGVTYSSTVETKKAKK